LPLIAGAAASLQLDARSGPAQIYGSSHEEHLWP